jgi:hypothetical protein
MREFDNSLDLLLEENIRLKFKISRLVSRSTATSSIRKGAFSVHQLSWDVSQANLTSSTTVTGLGILVKLHEDTSPHPHFETACPIPSQPNRVAGPPVGLRNTSCR